MRSENERVVYLKDYTPSPYLIDRVELDVRLAAEVVRVRALLHITPREGTPPATPLVLDGDELKLDSIAIDGLPLPLVSYEEVATGLVIDEPPTRPFVLETEVSLRPESNTKLMGLYRSSGTWVPQCEPEGFRRITYFLDRPDVLARPPIRSWLRCCSRTATSSRRARWPTATTMRCGTIPSPNPRISSPW